MSEVALDRPVPHPGPVTEPFWVACRRHELTVQVCGDCGRLVFYPRSTCPRCSSSRLGWQAVSGRAHLVTFTVARRPTHRRLAQRVPYVIAIVELEEGPRMTSTVVVEDISTLTIGQKLVVGFEDLEDVTVPVFRLA